MVRSTRKPGVRGFTAVSSLALAIAAGNAAAAQRNDLHLQDVSAVNQQYAKVASQLGANVRGEDRHAEMLGLSASSKLQVLESSVDADGTTHYRYQQMYKGLPIFGEQVVVSESKSGALKNLFGRAVHGLDAELAVGGKLLLDEASALQLGKRAALGKKLAGAVIQREKSQRVVFIDDADVAHIAFHTEVLSDKAGGGDPSRTFTIIDAQSGKVLKQWEGLTHALVGTGPGGNTKTGQYEWGSGGRYGFLDVAQSGTTCTMNNTSVKTVNLNGGTSGSTAFAYTCPRNTVKAINGAYAPLNDAHYFGGVTNSMYQSYLGRNPLTFQLLVKVHYSTSYENAFWNGSEMTFGDGATTFHPLVSLDVMSHEVSHGFTEQNSNLTYSGQSGGINEAYSDIAGEAAEFFWKGTNDFLVGPEIFKGTGSLRYMANPPQDGRSIDNAANFTSSMDVHYSSGVYNKAFYLLATKTGWTTKKAFQVFARANDLYWTSSTTFNQGACGVETAATDLAFVKADVTAAFTSVGVSCATTPPPTGGGVLTNGVAKTSQAGAAGSSTNYTMVVPAGATGLKFVTSGGTGDSDLYVKFGSAPTTTVFDCKSEGGTNAETCSIATAQAGTYYVLVKGYTAFSGMSITGSYTAGGGGGTTQTYSNATVFNIGDNTTVDSPITVSGRSGNAPTTASVSVNITHTYQGDLKVDLVAPDGTLYNIHNRTGSGTDNVIKTVTLNLSSELINGTWKMRVNDNAAGDTGKLNSWSINM